MLVPHSCHNKGTGHDIDMMDQHMLTALTSRIVILRELHCLAIIPNINCSIVVNLAKFLDTYLP
jgi:hypothetical protein